MQSQPNRSPYGKQKNSIEESTDGITLLSDASGSQSDSENQSQDFHSVIQYQDSEILPNNKEQDKSKNNRNDDDDELIFEPTEGHSASRSQNNSAQNERESLQNNKKILNQISYNDTISYLEDLLGSTYLNNLSKNSVIQEAKHLPPKIQSSSTCVQASSKADLKNQKELHPLNKLNQKQQNFRSQKAQKVPPDEKFNPFVKKVETKQAPFNEQLLTKEKKYIQKNVGLKDERKQEKKRDLSTNKSVSKIKRKDEVRDKSASKTVDHKRETRNRDASEEYRNYQQRPYYPYQNSSQSESQQPHYAQYPPYPQYSPHLNYPPPYNQIPPYYNYQKHPQQVNGPYYKQALYNGPGQYYVPNYQRKKQRKQRDQKQMYEIINGWYYPDRGNVMYDRQDRPWVVEGQTSIEDRYFSQLMKKQFLTALESESLARYIDKRKQQSQYVSSLSFYPSPYENHPSMTSLVPNDFYHQQSNSVSEPSNNSQISTKTTPLNLKAKNHDSSARQQPVVVQPKVNEVKVAPKQQSVKMAPHQEPRIQPKQEYAYQQRRQAPQKYRPKVTQSQKIPSQILPYDILKHEPFLEQPKIRPPITQIKQINKLPSKSEVFLLYNIPIIVSNEQLKDVSAEIYLVPYSHLMIQENHSTKWIEHIQKLTGIDIIKKLSEMNEKEVRERGRNIPEGTLSKIKLNRKINHFSSMYLIKLTNFMDIESKKPHGQTLLKDSIQRILESLIVGSSSSEKTLLIYGQRFPGVQKELTPKLIANFMYMGLANVSLEYKNRMTKGTKIIINVSKQEEYIEYTKYFRKVLIQYRKLNAMDGF